MKNFILKNKVKIISTLFFAFLLLILNNNVFASSNTVTYNGITFTLPDNIPDNYLIYSTDYYNEYYLCFPLQDDTVWGFEKYNNLWHLHAYTDFNSIGTDKNLSTFGMYWMKRSSTDFSSAPYNELNWIAPTNNLSQENLILYSSSDIYNSDKTLFFQVAPPEEIPETPEEETPKATTLLETMEQVEKGAVLKEIVALLPVILSVLVSLIALRKALKMLLAFLRVS